MAYSDFERGPHVPDSADLIPPADMPSVVVEHDGIRLTQTPDEFSVRVLDPNFKICRYREIPRTGKSPR